MSSHGYNYFDRDRDRTYILANALQDDDPKALTLLRSWGVRYILGEWLPLHFRPSEGVSLDETLSFYTCRRFFTSCVCIRD